MQIKQKLIYKSGRYRTFLRVYAVYTDCHFSLSGIPNANDQKIIINPEHNWQNKSNKEIDGATYIP